MTAQEIIQDMTQDNKDIQPQAEPYIVKSHDIHIDADYADWIADIKSRYWFYAEKIKKLKQLVSLNGAEKMHQAGAELINPKLQQFVGELQFAMNHGIASQVKSNWPSACASCKRSCRKPNG